MFFSKYLLFYLLLFSSMLNFVQKIRNCLQSRKNIQQLHCELAYYYYSAIFIIFIPEFPIETQIFQTQRGHPRIHHNGYTYGAKNLATIHHYEQTTWVCTRTGTRPNGTTGRCLAKIETKMINGLLMMRFKDPNHVCIQQN